MNTILSGLIQAADDEHREQRTEALNGSEAWEALGNGYIADEDVEVSEQLGSLEGESAASILFSFLDGSDEAVFIIDNDGIMIYANKECRNLFDRDRGELLGNNLFEYENADNEPVRERVLGAGESIQRDEEIELDDGSIRYSERSVHPLFGEEGSVIGAIEINRDVTERVLSQRREEAIREYQATAISALKQSIRQLGEGDFTVAPSLPEPDEEFDDMQAVAEEFEQMTADLRNAVDSTNQALVEARRTAEELNRLSTRLQRWGSGAVDAVADIETANERVASVTKNQDERTSEVEQNVSALSAAIEEVTTSSQEIQEQAQKATTLAADGTETAEDVIEQMDAAIDASEQNVEQVESLEAQMEKIGEMTDIIDDIAEQTNILALNANVEAARADGSGSEGFAVVADEVKQLAEDSKEAVSEISAVLETLGGQINDTAQSINRSNDRVQEASTVVAQVVETTNEISDAISRTEEDVTEISTAIDDQAENTEDILEVVEKASNASETVETRMRDVATSVETQADIVDRVTEAADTIDNLGDDLNRQLSSFEIADPADTHPTGRDGD